MKDFNAKARFSNKKAVVKIHSGANNSKSYGNERKIKIENALLTKREAVCLIDQIRFERLSGNEYRILRDALENMSIILEDDLAFIERRYKKMKEGTQIMT